MKRLLLAGALAAALVSMPARAQTFPIRYVFAAVDAVQRYSNSLKVTGVVDGETAPQTVTMNFASGTDNAAACERLAVLAMTRPGQFRFEIEGYTSSTLTACKLARATP